MKLRKLEIKVKTSGGPYQATINFPDGLVVIWADNSRGKSTCVRAIISVLGLESMLTTDQKTLPFPPSLTEKLRGEDGKEVLVLESDIYLEVENKSGNTVTFHRIVKSSSNDRISNIITVHEGPLLTNFSSQYTARDFYVNRKGAVQGHVGFHHFLAEFLGWNLPNVAKYNGDECPLYLQCVFPYFIVEQTKGWQPVQPTVPTQFQIKDPAIRAAEFILNLDVTRMILEKQRLLQERDRIKADWESRVSALRLIAKEHAAVLAGIPDLPIVSWPPDVPYSIGLDNEGEIVPLKRRLVDIKKESEVIAIHDIPKTNEVIGAVEKELSETQIKLRYSELFLNQLREELAIKQEAYNLIKRRISAVRLDLQRHKDVQTLLKLGGKNYESIGEHRCPTCKQSIHDSLIPNPADHPVMSLDENVIFLDEQRKTLDGLFRQAQGEMERASALLQAQERLVNETRGRIRILKETLVQDGHTPSIEAIQKRIVLENAIVELEGLNDLFESEISYFEPLSNDWRNNSIALKQSREIGMSQDDEKKIQLWNNEFRSKLRAFGFTSLNVDQIELSSNTFRPEKDESEYNVSNACSASDGIRMIWAYLVGILAVARYQQINHPGFLIFDEPRQQNANLPSFSGLTLESAKAKAFGQQVIIFTSEDNATLQERLDKIPNKYSIKKIKIPTTKFSRRKIKTKFLFHHRYIRLITIEKDYSLQSFDGYVITKAPPINSDTE